jgi:hypothetical protein
MYQKLCGSIIITMLCCLNAYSKPIQLKQLTSIEKTKLTQYCPAIKTLYKDKDGKWKAPHGWSSFRDAPFVNVIGSFAGAQFQGAATIGQMICLYRGTDQQSFPVVLGRGNLVLRPEKKLWKLDKSGAYLICAHHNRKKCGFIAKKDVELMNRTNVYQDLSSIKPKK